MAFCWILSYFNSLAQSSIHHYQYNQVVSPYQEISGGTLLGNTSIDEQVFNNSTTGTGGTVTDIGFPIGFNFVYNNQSYSRFAVATNGYIKLGNGSFPITGSVAAAFTQTFDTLGLKQIIGAMHGDLEGQMGSSLRFQTIGTAPSRELVVQWKKFKFWATTGPDSISFQIRLFETSNQIGFCYGNILRNETDKVVSVGMIGDRRNEALMRRARIDSSETWQTSSINFSPNTKCDFRTAFKPVNGLKMYFYGLPPIPDDLALVGIKFSDALSFGCAGTATEPLSLIVENRGTNPQSISLYGLWVNGVNQGTNALGFSPPLEPGERRTVPLSQTVNMANTGIYQITAYTSLANDTGAYQNNDTAKVTKQIFSPASIPAAPIRNLSEFAGKGWSFYQGRNKPQKSGTKFQTLNYYYSPTYAVYISAFPPLNDTIQEWVVSPAYQPAVGQILKFRASITYFDTITAVPNIDDDRLSVLITTDCGVTWQNLLTLNQASIGAGQLSNNKIGYSIPISATTPFQVAFHINNNATNPTNGYYFHLDDITMSLGNAFDLSARSVQVVGLGATGCTQTTFPVQVWIKNVGDSAIGSTPVRLRVNANTPLNQTFTFNPALGSGDSAMVTFANVSLPPNNTYKLLATVVYPNEDGFSSANDTSATSVYYLGSANPMTLPVSIDFNAFPTGIPAGWLVEQGSFLDFRVRVRGIVSSRSLSANLNYSNQSSLAIMPLTGALPANQVLTYFVRFVNDNGATFFFGPNDSASVWVSDNCGGSFTRLQTLKAGNPVGIGAFASTAIDLSAYEGKSISIKFEVFMNRSDFTGAWMDVDNISIAPNVSVSPKLLADAFQVFPNPAKDKVEIRIPNGIDHGFVRLVDMNGKTVASDSWNMTRKEVTFSTLYYPSGIYLIQMGNEAGVISKKLVIE